MVVDDLRDIMFEEDSTYFEFEYFLKVFERAQKYARKTNNK